MLHSPSSQYRIYSLLDMSIGNKEGCSNYSRAFFYFCSSPYLYFLDIIPSCIVIRTPYHHRVWLNVYYKILLMVVFWWFILNSCTLRLFILCRFRAWQLVKTILIICRSISFGFLSVVRLPFHRHNIPQLIQFLFLYLISMPFSIPTSIT